jgi:RNA polymerase sigma-70 factor, ECF subfamily
VAVDYERLFHQYYPQLFRYLNRLTADADVAEDAAQEAFVRLAERRLTEAEARPWLFTVATNLVRDRARKAERHRRLGELVPMAEPPVLPDMEVERRETVARVRRALDALPERDRVMLLMREEGFQYGEIAGAVGVASTSVGTLLARAGRRFADAFSAQSDSRETVNEPSR